jgi:hypothetical protein
MTDADLPVQPDVDEAPGWYVTDADGNVVASGPLTEALPASGVGETPAEGDE